MAGLADVVERGNRLDALCALRDVLAHAIEGCDSNRDLAALTQRLVDVLDAIDSAGGVSDADDPEDSTFDELAKRRSARGAEPARVERSGRG